MRRLLFLFFLLLLAASVWARDMQIAWPDDEHMVLQLRIGPFANTGVYAGGSQMNFSCDVRIKSVWTKPFTGTLNMQVFDKGGVQIGVAPLYIADLLPGKEVDIPVYFTTVGMPNTVKLVAERVPAEFRIYMPQRAVALTIRSVPDGASLRVDNEDMGVTPKVLDLTPGVHKLEFKKEGFTPYMHALAIQPDEAPGGSISIELSASGDIVELRDGTVLTGDLDWLDFKVVRIKVNGKLQVLNRNDVQRITLVPRAN